MLFSEFQSMWQPVSDPVVNNDIDEAVTLTPPAGADGIVIWSLTQAIDVKVLEKASTDVAVDGEGIAIAAGQANARVFWTHDAKLSVIEAAATGELHYFWIKFPSHKNA